MKNPCKDLENTFWIKDGIEYELILGNTFWKLQTSTDTINLPLSKNCPKPERIVNWLEQYGYTKTT
jgi:hypothetical protein